MNGETPSNDPLGRTFGRLAVSSDERRDRVRATFRAVAPRYDLMNDLMSLGIHRLWKRRFAALADARAGETALDLAGGTGDVAFLLKRSGARVTVADPSVEMMAVGRSRPGGAEIDWVEAEAETLPFPDAHFDLVTIAFGIRNVTRMDAALNEIARVLKPGGRFLCLEFSTPRPWLAPFYGLWSRTAIPALGAAVSGRIEAYRYLVESIGRFPDQARFAGLVRSAGFTDVIWRDLSFGIAAIHGGRKARAASNEVGWGIGRGWMGRQDSNL
ncbi:MAG: class I SAM-dependent methyltransferase [Hyphomicrobiales bacterium]|nr:class I SAM-dependent methyltransferase [Hyphomicrobiales bacterium]